MTRKTWLECLESGKDYACPVCGAYTSTLSGNKKDRLGMTREGLPTIAESLLQRSGGPALLDTPSELHGCHSIG
jgi:hypothetical protein